MHNEALLFIQDLAVIMLVAGTITILCHQLKQPIVLGYIIAGIIAGPYTPPFSLIANESTIHTLADLGVIFLMFALGLEFDLRKLGKVGVPSFITALTEISLMMGLGFLVGKFFNWGTMNSIFLGALLSISSTTIIIKVLNDLGMKKDKAAPLIFGILIFEDIFAILMLVFLSIFAVTGKLPVNEMIFNISKLSLFLIVSVAIGFVLVPRLLDYVAKFKSKEMILISVLALCFGFCLIVLKLQYSIALGAFLMGAIIAESSQVELVERLILPLRDMFSAIFFVSVGLLFNPTLVSHYFIPIIIITLLVVFGKIITTTLSLLLTGRDGKTAMQVGMSLAQIGEFSFIIASLGVTLEVIDNFLYSIAVAVSIITTLLSPYLIKYSETTTLFAAKWMPKKLIAPFKRYQLWVQNNSKGNSGK